jgi:two-component system phosphate regulon sensor histidine kinase PhoR
MNKIFNRFFFYFLLVLLVNLAVSTILVITYTRRDFDANLREQLFSSAQFVSELMKAKGLDAQKQKELELLIEDLGKRLNMRITIILPEGRVYADSFYDAENMENHIFRIEVQKALQGHSGMDTRISPTLGIPMTYLALPVYQDDALQALVRVSLTRKTIRDKINQTIFKSILTGTFLGIVVALVVSFILARVFSHPIRLIRDAAANISEGDFNRRLQLDRKDELQQVAESLNQMSAKLGNFFESIKDEKEKIAAILSGMKEALILVSGDQKILMVNHAFCEMFDRDEKKLTGRLYWEVLLEREIAELIQKALQSKTSDFSSMTFRKEENNIRYLHMSASPVVSESSVFKGIVIVFHDITHIKKADKMRREFVDNASHELKTPLSSLLAVSETLIDREPPDKETRMNFYHKLLDNSLRLNQLTEDLLSLSEIEQNKNSLEKDLIDLPGILTEIVDEFQPDLKAKNHEFKMNIAPDIPKAHLDKKSFKKALANILDNAIRYTNDGGSITLIVRKSENEILIDIQDSGTGIPPEDIPRIFERFYRVDKARSVKLGGTGLGLSISKHIIEAHDGNISVTSKPGEGSVFTIHLPVIQHT